MSDKWIPKKAIESILRREFITPFIGSIRKDPVISLKLSNALVLLKLSEGLIVKLDKDEVAAGGDVEKVTEKALFLGYFGKVYQSSILLAGATDYLGAMILTRSLFELLIGIATPKNGSMRDRISSISFLDSKEKGDLHRLWNKLNAWAHPYGKWLKNICPMFYGIGRNHHSEMLNKCLEYSDQILDFMLTITIDYFKINPCDFTDEFNKVGTPSKMQEISKLDMFEKRLARCP
jgi:hypothetical protein